MLTDGFFVTLAAGLRSALGAEKAWYLAVGAGDPAWDRNPLLLDPGVARLNRELARKALTPDGVEFLDAGGTPSSTATACLRVRVRFGSDEANGTLREVGLFAGAREEADSGVLVSYFAHAAIQKTAEMSLERSLRLDLTRRKVGGAQPTRFFGNTKSREIHDLQRTRDACRLDEVTFDHRLYFDSAQQAIDLGYDYCAHCFGRDLSRR
jgi:hypothetical protein